jgi:diaminohydroxyphosphoribosylaminopyrimidine deaminase/5-amino-6-(5-phosphoribosylamino)uracil reductase
MTKAKLKFSKQDNAYMKMALDLSRRGLGRTSPNPSVGCVIVKDGHVIGRGWTSDGGRPHGEINALQQENDVRNATVYVTLEPCAHHGNTPPCAEALVEAGVSKVIVATGDPDTRVSGKGIEILQNAGIEVFEGLMKEEADKINQGFFLKVTDKRPLITVKIASSEDGKIAKIKDEQSWVTGPGARMRGHLYRANHDAILVGINTVLIDDPMLDCRIAGLSSQSPIRIILDSHLRLRTASKICETAREIDTWVMTLCQDREKITSLEAKGISVIKIDKNAEGRISLTHVSEVLAKRGITRLLSEGGAQVNASLIKEGLVDHLIWFKSTESIGATGVNALYDISITELGDYLNLTLIDEGVVGEDNWQEFMTER